MATAPARLAAPVASLGTAQLGNQGPTVSRLCLGTMLFGEGTGEREAHALLGAAAEGGVTFLDSAEMYPVPQRAATQGASEAILGTWLAGRRREDYVVATKVAGPSGQMTWIRGGPHALDARNIREAIAGSLARLRTDYIDLIQLHWPDRYVPMFGEVAYDPARAHAAVPLEEQLGALADAVEAGAVRAVGLSNETPWGLMEALRLAKADSRLPRVAALQNAYSLLCRGWEAGLAEVCAAERVAMLAYSPLAMGLLTGKYLAADGGPPGARLNRYRQRYAEAESRYSPAKPNVRPAVEAYVALARQAGISPTELALRFVLSHPLVTSAVVGATSQEQLQELLAAAARPALPPDVMAAVDAIHERYPNPTP